MALLLALLGAGPTAAGTWAPEFRGTLGRVGDGGYTQVLSHDGALWVSTQSYGDDNVNVRNLTVLTCGAEPPIRCERSAVRSGTHDQDLGRFHRSALGANGLPAFCYADSPAVKVSRCTDARCAEFTTEVVDPDAPNGKSWSSASKCSLAPGARAAAISQKSDGPLYIALQDPSTKRWRRELALAGHPKTDHPSAAIDPDDSGALAVSFASRSSNSLAVLRCRIDGPPGACARTANVSVWDATSPKSGVRYTQAAFKRRADGTTFLSVHYIAMDDGTLRRCDEDGSGGATITKMAPTASKGSCPGLSSCPYGGFLTTKPWTRGFESGVTTSYFDESRKMTQYCCRCHLGCILLKMPAMSLLTDGNENVGRLVVADDKAGELWSDVGADGYGRDSSLTFVADGIIAVSYMNYSHNTTLKELRLAILSERPPMKSDDRQQPSRTSRWWFM